MKKKLLTGFAILLGALAFCATSAIAIPFDISGPPAMDVDPWSATYVYVTLTTTESGIIDDLNVQIELGYNDEEPGPAGFWGNFDIWLTHDGMMVQLFETMDDYFGTFDVVFDDEAASSIPDIGVDYDVYGTFIPIGSLSAFNGYNLSGDWTLILLDDFIPGDGTNLISWGISGDTAAAPVPEPSTMLLVGTGLLGIAFGRKRFNKKA